MIRIESLVIISSMIEAVIFDFGRTLYDPVTLDLFPGSVQVLTDLRKRGIRLSLVTIAQDENVRLEELIRFGVDGFFSPIKVLGLRQAKDFSSIARELGTKPLNIGVVGDNLKREIPEGNRIGAYTWWTRQRLLNPQLQAPKSGLQCPRDILQTIDELVPKIDSLNT